MNKHLAPVRSLTELRSRAQRDVNYQKLVMSSLKALDLKANDWVSGMKELEYESLATSEEDVVEAVNGNLALDNLEV